MLVLRDAQEQNSPSLLAFIELSGSDKEDINESVVPNRKNVVMFMCLN